MEKPPAFQFYAKDWLSSNHIALMTPAEEGAYIRLLSYCWGAEDCGIPDDDAVLAQLSRLGEGWHGSAMKIRACFVSENGRLRNKRLLSERKKQDEHRLERQRSGRKGAKGRWGKNLSQPKPQTPRHGLANGSAILQNGSAINQPMAKNGSSSASSSSSSSAIASPLASATAKPEKEIEGKKGVRGKETEPRRIPASLDGLRLYEHDADLCEHWQAMEDVMLGTYPWGLEWIRSELKRAHIREVTEPRTAGPARRKFLENWFHNAHVRETTVRSAKGTLPRPPVPDDLREIRTRCGLPPRKGD